ncbi:hypothetical protein JIN87_28040 [Pelagicoccus mobilis]|uniref:Uncharacterized protein n=2 Tax=Pelagicoccus mobilis TaxID=415221 RepID=A0A934S1Q9_9BACT|nr:hypothetical protein [Pelagicoccus mobilis]
MKIRLLQFALLALFIPSVATSVAFKKRSRIEVTNHLRTIYTHALVYAADNEERLPEKIDDLNELMKEDEDLLKFVKDPKFGYHGSGKGTWEINGDIMICTYSYPNEGRLAITGWGNTVWEDEKKEEHIKSSLTTPGAAAPSA